MKRKGRRALVTGSTRGIGKAIALELAVQGATVAVHGPADDAALDAALEAVRAVRSDAIKVAAELSDSAAIRAMFAAVDNALGGLDVLVNNAATQNPSPFIDLKEEDWDRVLAVNLKAPFIASQRAAALMRRNGAGGKIINISSVHAYDARRHYAHYSTSKGGLEMLTKCMALELAADNIQVNSVVPGAIATELTPADRSAVIATAIPAGHVGDVRDVARLVAFLASDASNYITGASIRVDGGLTLGFCASRPEL